MRSIVLGILLCLIATSCSSSNENKPAGGSSKVVISVVPDSITTLYEQVEDAIKKSEETLPQNQTANGEDNPADSSEVTETTGLIKITESTIPAPTTTTTTTTTTATVTTTVVPQFDDEMLTEEPYRAENFDESVEPNA